MIVTNLMMAVAVLIQVESRGDPECWRMQEDAVGILQIRPVMVQEVNRLLGWDKYNYLDRWDQEKSIEMCLIYLNRYANRAWLGHAPTLRDCSRLWQSGPRGPWKAENAWRQEHLRRMAREWRRIGGEA